MKNRLMATAALAAALAAPAAAQTPATPGDTLSYAAGMAMTDGLVPYLQQNLGVDTAYMADFVRGFKEGTKNPNDQKMKAYAAGLQIAQMVEQRMLPGLREQLEGTGQQISSELFARGFAAALTADHSVLAPADAQTLFTARMDEAKAAKAEKQYGANRRAGEEFLAANAKKEGVKVLPSGLQYKVLTEGTGEVPTEADEVVVKYEGKLIDGTVFDSSYERKEQTNRFRPSQVIKGWTEALTMMPVGSKWQLFIPQQLAYGSREAGKIKPYSALIFTVELVGVDKAK